MWSIFWSIKTYVVQNLHDLVVICSLCIFLSYFFEAAPEVSSMDDLTQEQQEILDKVSWYIYLTIYSCIQQSRYKWSAHLEYLFTV